MFPALNIDESCEKTDEFSFRFFRELLSQCENATVLISSTPKNVDWILTPLQPFLHRMKYVAVTDFFAASTTGSDEIIISTRTFKTSSWVSTLKHLIGEGKIRPMTLHVGDENMDLAHLHLEQLFKLHLCSGQRMRNTLTATNIPKCSHLTHLSIAKYSFYAKIVTALSEAVKTDRLPVLSHLSFTECKGLERQIQILFRSPWRKLTHLHLPSCELDFTDLKYLFDELSNSECGKLPNVISLILLQSKAQETDDSKLIFTEKSLSQLTTLHVERADLSTFRVLLDAVRMTKVAQLGVTLSPNSSSKQLVQAHDLPPLESLVLRHFSLNSLSEIASVVLHERITFLDLSFSLGLSGNMPQLFHGRFKSLKSLILSDCKLQSYDLSMLNRDLWNQFQLTYLDISRNPGLTSLNFDFFKGLYYLHIEHSSHATYIDELLEEGSLNQLLELSISNYQFDGLKKKSLSNLQTLRIFDCDKELVDNIADAEKKGLFPKLRNVCIASCTNRFELCGYSVIAELIKKSISCHFASEFDNMSFMSLKCMCQQND